MSKRKPVRSIRELSKLLGRVRYPLCILLTTLFMATSPVYASTWDVTADFSVSSNPNGSWSYGYWGDSFTLFSDKFTDPGGFGWWRIPGEPDGYYLPAVWKNVSTYRNGVQAGEIALHPISASYGAATVRWTSPGTGTVNVSGYFGAGDTGRMAYCINKNNTNIIAVRHAN